MPKSVKIIIAVTAITSILSPLLSFLLNYFHLQGPLEWFPLTLLGIQKGWIWQLVTYLFLQSAHTHITLTLLFTIFISLFLLGFSGKEIAIRFGNTKFVLFYLGAGVFSGLVALAYLYFFPSPVAIVGSQSALFASLVVWTMLFSDLQLSYFYLVRVKAKWLVAALFAIPLLIHLSTGSFAFFFNELAGIVYGYLFGRFIFNLAPLFHFRKKGSKIVNISDYHDDYLEKMLHKLSDLTKKK